MHWPFVASIHCCFDESYCFSIAEGFPAVHDSSHRSASMAAPIVLKTWRVYEALTHLMIPWWSGWISVVVFGCKNSTWTFSSSMLMEWVCQGTLSIIRKTFNDNRSFSKYSLTSRMKHWWNHSVNNTAVTHALRLCCKKMGRIFLFLFLRARGFFSR